MLDKIDEAVANYHAERVIFADEGVRPSGFSLPRQHSMTHYRPLIREFGAPGGLCSSITESKHIKAVKEPWHRSSRYEALGQMITINERLDKLHASRVDFESRGMLRGSLFGDPLTQEEIDELADNEDEGASETRNIMGEVRFARIHTRNIPRQLPALAEHINQPHLPEYVRRFLYGQLNGPIDISLHDVPLADCPSYDGTVRVFPSAIATFFAPGDLSGIAGMHRERIRCTPSWRKSGARHDCVFIEHDPDVPGFRGLHVARVFLLFSIKHQNIVYPCALIQWYSVIGDEPDSDTGLWMVKPDQGKKGMDVVHLDAVLRSAHLIGVSGRKFIPKLKHTDSLNAFKAFYVNKYADHHSHEIAF
ncbi:hypothetical protein C8J56DRAFT_1049096 [Mycena floridula]|nr:hypothetical protein C8J56DRAFT_1049096 [Mycena floridula]